MQIGKVLKHFASLQNVPTGKATGTRKSEEEAISTNGKMRPKEMIVSLSHVFPKRILVYRLLLPVLYSSSGSDQVLLMNAGTVSSTYGKGVTELLSRWNTGCDMRRTDVETHEGKLVASVLRASDYTDNLCCLGLEYLDLEVLYRCRQFFRTISVSFIIYSSFTVAAC